MERFDVDALDDGWPFEIDEQVAHLFKHPSLGTEDIGEIWTSDPLFYPSKPPAHWLMVAEGSGRVLVVPWRRPTAAIAAGAVPSAATSRRQPRPPLPGRSMTDMTPEQENAFYADPDNQVPQGLPVRRRTRLAQPVPVRLSDELLREVRERAAADDRSVSGWIRRAVEHELARSRS